MVGSSFQGNPWIVVDSLVDTNLLPPCSGVNIYGGLDLTPSQTSVKVACRARHTVSPKTPAVGRHCIEYQKGRPAEEDWACNRGPNLALPAARLFSALRLGRAASRPVQVVNLRQVTRRKRGLSPAFGTVTFRSLFHKVSWT